MPRPRPVSAGDRRLIEQFDMLKNLKVSVWERDVEGGTQTYADLEQVANEGNDRQAFAGTLGMFRKVMSRINEALERAQVRGQVEGGPRAPREIDPSRENPLVAWSAAVILDRLTETGAVGRVVASSQDGDAMARYCQKNREFVLYPGTFVNKPAANQPVEVEREEGGPADIKRRMDFLAWKQEQGKHYQWGVWYDRKEAPKMDQFVLFTQGFDDWYATEDRRVTPLRPHSPGSPGTPKEERLVLIEVSESIGAFRSGKIVGFPINRAEAKAEVKELDAQWELKSAIATPKGLEQFGVNRGFGLGADDDLREMAEQFKQEEEARQQEARERRSMARDASPQYIRHVRGNHEAKVFEHVGKDGERSPIFMITRETTDADGQVRIRGKVLDVVQLKELRERLEARIGQQKARGRDTSEGPAPAEDLEARSGQGRARGRDISEELALVKELEGSVGQKQPPGRVISEGPAPEREAGSASQGPGTTKPLPPQKARKPEERAEVASAKPKLDLPTPDPVTSPTPERKDNRFCVVGVWYGANPPELGNLAIHTQGKEEPEQRMMLPGTINREVVEPTGSPTYIIGKVVTRGLVSILETTKDLGYAKQRERELEQAGLAKEQSRERIAMNRGQMVRPDLGPSMGY